MASGCAHLRTSEADEALVEWARAGTGTHAYGVYILGGSKIGWSVQSSSVEGDDESGLVLVERSEFFSRIKLGEKVIESHSQSVTRYQLAGDGPLLSARSVKLEDGVEVVTEVFVVEDGVEIVRLREGHSTRRHTPPLKETLAEHLKFGRWLESGPPKGATFSNWASDWDSDQVNQVARYRYGGLEPYRQGGVTTMLHHLTIDVFGVRNVVQLTETGVWVRGVMAGLLELRAEEEVLARRLDAPVDLVAAASIPLDRSLGDPENLPALSLWVAGSDTLRIPDSPRQRVERTEGGAFVVQLRRSAQGNVESLSRAARLKFLAANGRMQLGAPEVVRAARRFDSVGSALERGRAISTWVHGRLRKAIVTNADTAVDVLRGGAGDCTEHALLFVTLARAVALPARTVGGLVYVDDEKPHLAWHTWAEFHDGRQWIAIDPTWNQFPIDVSHLTLSVGIDDWSWLDQLGTLRVRVLD